MTSGRRTVASRVIGLVVGICRVWSLICFLGLFFLMVANVASRYLGLPSIIWSVDGTSFTMVWMILTGAVLVMAAGTHISLAGTDGIPDQGRPMSPLGAFVALCSALALAIIGVSGAVFAVDAIAQKTFLLQLPRALWYAAIPVAAALMLVVLIARVTMSLRKEAFGALGETE